MPPKVKYTKQAVIDAAVQLVEKQGLKGGNRETESKAVVLILTQSCKGAKLYCFLGDLAPLR